MMRPDTILDTCRTKGIDCIGTGDALHPAWRDLWEPHLSGDDRIVVVPTTEVEDANRIHHLIIMPDFGTCRDLGLLLSPASRDINTTGRPHVRMTGDRIAEAVHDCGGLIGPAHAFTPWTALYGRFSSLSDSYRDERIDFLELGLSADTSYASGIAEIGDVPFLSNSDAHSPDPAKIGREYFCLSTRGRSAEDVISALREGKIVSNTGFFPEEGKYNRTACSRCFEQFPLHEAERLTWKCPYDKAAIKKGVRDRAQELSQGIPSNRPPYLHCIPLGEMIQKVQKCCSTHTRSCLTTYSRFIATFGDEISVLTTVPVAELAGVDGRVAQMIGALRSGDVVLIPGGGGKYGSFSIPGLL